MNKTTYVSHQSVIEYVLTIAIFFLSLQNKTMLVLSILLSLMLLSQRQLGVIKLLYLYMMRFIISSGIDFQESQTMIIVMKYIVLYGCGLFWVFMTMRHWIKNQTLSIFVFASVVLMSIYGLMGLLTSDFPMIVISKLFSYFVPLMIVVILISQIERFIDVIAWISHQIIFLILWSAFYTNQPIGYLLNGYSFQGVLNHPNLFAVILVMGLVTLLVLMIMERRHLLIYSGLMLIGIYELLISNSRTAVFSLFVCFVLAVIIIKVRPLYKFLLVGSTIALVLVSMMSSSLWQKAMSFIQKGQTSNNILLSRYGQIDNVSLALHKSPFFGDGFGIPFNNTSLALASFTFEAGNIIFGLLIFTGVIGLVLYLIYLGILVFSTPHVFRISVLLFVVTLLVNMGEMIMFSSINIGIFCYILWGLYLKEGMTYGNNKSV